MNTKNNLSGIIGFALFALASQSAMATICTGTCGTLGANGVVTAPTGTTTYNYVTTEGSNSFNVSPFPSNINTNVDTNGSTFGSTLVSNSFQASSGDSLNFNFNYVTSDGKGYPPLLGYGAVV